MKIIFHIILFLMITASALGQQISVTNFRKLPMDMDARIDHPRIDQNGEKAALIKVVTPETDFKFDIGLMKIVGRENKVGEIWVYVPRGTIKLTISHTQLGIIRDYELKERIDAATTYEMILSSGRVITIVEESSDIQYFVLRYTPANVSVDVYFDNDIYIKGENGVVTQRLKYGSHNYKVEAYKYKTVAGVVEIGNEREEVNIVLESTHGSVDFKSQPSGAELYINNELVGKTPLLSHELKHGTYSYRMELPRYKTIVNNVLVSAVKADVNDVLVSTSGTLNFSSLPESGAEIYINGELTGKTPFVSDELEEGEYSITVKSEYYLPHTQIVTVLAEGRQVDVPLTLRPNFAMISVLTDPHSSILLDEVDKGSGEVKMRLTAGYYTLEAQRRSHRSTRESIEVVAGVDMQYTLPSPTPMYGTLDISSNVVGAKVYLDGEYLGTSPNLFRNQFIGIRKLEVKAEGYSDYKEEVTIHEAKLNTHAAKLTSKAVYVDYTPPYIPKILPYVQPAQIEDEDKVAKTSSTKYKAKWRHLFMAGMGFSDMIGNPYSITYACYKKAGFYIRAESNFDTKGIDIGSSLSSLPIEPSDTWDGTGGSSYSAAAFGMITCLYRNVIVLSFGGFYGQRYDYGNTTMGNSILLPYSEQESDNIESDNIESDNFESGNIVYGLEAGLLFGIKRFTLGFNCMYDLKNQTPMTNVYIGINF